MRVSAIAREAWLNAAGGTSRALLVGIALLVVTLPVQISDLSLTRQYVHEADAYQASGASVQTVSAPERIDGSACAALERLPGVRAAGAIREAQEELVVAALPRSPIPLYEVTTGFPALLHASDDGGAGVILSEDAVAALGRADVEVALADGRDVHVRGTYASPDDGRRSGFGFAALAITTTTAPFDECWVDAWPQDASLRSLLLTTVLDGGSGPATQAPALAPLNSTHGDVFDGAVRNAHRVTVQAVPLAGLLALATCWAMTTLRRIELAAALHAGVHRVELLAILLLETLAWLVPVGAITGATVLFFSSSGPAGDAGATLVQGLRAPAISVLGALTGTMIGGLSAREDHLFRYVKTR